MEQILTGGVFIIMNIKMIKKPKVVFCKYNVLTDIKLDIADINLEMYFLTAQIYRNKTNKCTRYDNLRFLYGAVSWSKRSAFKNLLLKYIRVKILILLKNWSLLIFYAIFHIFFYYLLL